MSNNNNNNKNSNDDDDNNNSRDNNPDEAVIALWNVIRRKRTDLTHHHGRRISSNPTLQVICDILQIAQDSSYDSKMFTLSSIAFPSTTTTTTTPPLLSGPNYHTGPNTEISTAEKIKHATDLLTKTLTGISKKLLPFTANTNAAAPICGIRGRFDSSITQLCKALKHFSFVPRDGTHRDERPFITITAPPRQGKTALLDYVTRSSRILTPVKESLPEDETGKIIVFNVTFNSEFNVKNTATNVVDAVKNAKKEIALRLWSAIYGAFRLSEVDENIENLVELDLEPNEILKSFQIYCKNKNKNTQQETNRFFFFFLFDEFTNILPEAGSGFVGDIDSCHRQIYSLISSMISFNVAVITTGFFAPLAGIDTTSSNRPICLIDLAPLSGIDESRDLLPLRTEFINLIHRNHTLTHATNNNNNNNLNKYQEAVLHNLLVDFELAKSTPGVVGALLERLREGENDNTAIRFLVKVVQSNSEDLKTKVECTMNVLACKSFEFAEFVEQIWVDDSYAESTKSPIFNRIIKEAVHESMIHDQSTPKSDSAVSLYHFENAFVNSFFFVKFAFDFTSEPPNNNNNNNFFARAIRVLKTFVNQIQKYSECLINLIPQQQSTLVTHQIATRFGEKNSLGTSDSSSTPQVISSTLPAASTTGSVAATREDQHRRREVNGAAFEDFVASGWMFQQCCRLVFCTQTMKNAKLTTSVGRLLEDSTHLFSITPHGSDPKDFFPSLCWSSSLSTTSVPKSVEFDSQVTPYPRMDPRRTTQQRIPLVFNENLSPFSLIRPLRSISTDDESKLIENNPLVDIITHLHCSHANPQELVQVWIDKKNGQRSPFADHDGNEMSDEMIVNNVKNDRFDKNCPFLYNLKCSLDGLKDVIAPASRTDATAATTTTTSFFSKYHVRHILHIIVTSYKPSSSSPHFKCDTPLVFGTGLSSYSLFLVHPESKAFQNLVSQPVRDALPFSEAKQASSWCEYPGDFNTWSAYLATTRDPDSVAPTIKNEKDFRLWRKVCYDDDCAASIWNMMMSCRGVIDGKQKISDNFVCPTRTVIPMDVWNALRFRQFLISICVRKTTPFTTKDELRFDIPNNSCDKWTAVSQGRNGPPKVEVNIGALKILFSCVTIGHLLHDEQDYEDRFDNKEPGSTAGAFWHRLLVAEGTGGGLNSASSTKLAIQLWCTPVEKWNEEKSQFIGENNNNNNLLSVEDVALIDEKVAECRKIFKEKTNENL